jgi:hypothetical protein
MNSTLFTTCEICGKPLSLEVAKTDSKGKAVHEECYTTFLAKNYQPDAR